MLEELLAKEEGRILEFKENTRSLSKIIQTIVAFANTVGGGALVIGIIHFFASIIAYCKLEFLKMKTCLTRVRRLFP